MENNTTTTNDQAIVNQPSEKFVDYLLRSASESNESTEETYRRIIQETWERATVDNRKRVPVEELVTNHFKNASLLENRVMEAAEVIRNTLRKMTGVIPQELEWAKNLNYSSKIAHIDGIIKPRNPELRNSDLNVTSRILDKSLAYSDDFVVEFTFTSYWGRENTGRIPLGLLKGDPMAVAQYVRKLCRAANKRAIIENKATALKEYNDAVAEQKKIVERAAQKLEIAQSTKGLKPTSKELKALKAQQKAPVASQ